MKKGTDNAPRGRQTLARKIGSAESASHGENHAGRDGGPALRRRVRFGRLRGNQIAGLEREGLQTGDPGQVGKALQEAGIRDVKDYRHRGKAGEDYERNSSLRTWRHSVRRPLDTED